MKARRYVVSVGAGDPQPVALRYDLALGCWVAEVGGERLQIDVKAARGGAITVEVDGQDLPLELGRGLDGRVRLGVGGGGGDQALPVRVRSAGEIALSSPTPRSAAGKASPQVSCPITGLVLAVPVRPGQRVRKGEPLMTLESMKMETVVRSPRDGRVKRVHATAGQAVRTGGPLVELED